MKDHAARTLTERLAASIRAKEAFLADEGKVAAFAGAVEAIVRSYGSGGRLYIAGNGGSAADAQHLAAEFVCRFSKDRASIPAEALTVDTSTITAIGNDYGFDGIFSRQLEGKAGKDDVFLGITTSGNSANVIKALELCRSKGVTSVLLSGGDGGKAAPLSDHAILVEGEDTGAIQEVHIALEHALCVVVEERLAPGPDTGR